MMPFVLITAFGDEETTRRRDASAMLDKPFEMNELRKLVRNFAPPSRPS